MSSTVLVECDDDFAGCEERSDDGSDNGSDLEDFLVADDEKEEVEFSAVDRCAVTVENIVSGKRKRTQTAFYDQQVYSSAEYRNMVLDDVGEDEYEAALEDDVDEDSDQGEEEEDGEYTPDQEDEEEEGTEDEDDDTDYEDDEEEEYDTEEEEDSDGDSEVQEGEGKVEVKSETKSETQGDAVQEK